MGPAALLYLLRLRGDIVTTEESLVSRAVAPVRVVATVVLVTFVKVVRVDVVGPALVILAVVGLAVLRGGSDR